MLMYVYVFPRLARLSMSLFTELRGAVFAKVAQKGIRNIATSAFERLLDMDLAFHLNRNTGALSRALERGVRSIGLLTNMLTFNVVCIYSSPLKHL